MKRRDKENTRAAAENLKIGTVNKTIMERVGGRMQDKSGRIVYSVGLEWEQKERRMSPHDRERTVDNEDQE